MLRYCVNCRKDYEFPPTAVSGTADLICPGCGAVIDKNSRHPVDEEAATKTEEGMGRAALVLFRFCYIFYLALGIIGVVGFVTGMDKLLYAVTIIALVAFIAQYFTGTLAFTAGVIFLPLGAICGYLIFKSLRGACLGIHVVFLIRHFLRDIVYTLIFKLVRFGSDS
ncbi:MAG: hypothetical protein K5770_20310 [Lachnospiraceae bacterium]|nr:hypothetical protein [Lachnospiraceae bacterium]